QSNLGPEGKSLMKTSHLGLSIPKSLTLCTLSSGIPALSCRWASIEAVRSASELPLEWKTGEKTCEVGEGCQDLVMLLENGPQINLVIIKDCVKAEDQEPQVSWVRTGPGLSIVSYTRVCRHSDFCNDVSSTEVFGDLPTPTVPGSLRCPLCLSKDGCKNASEQVCPAGSSHCYRGVLRLRGGGITTNLRVQGCMPQPDCNLLNGTNAVGPLDMSENCGLQSGPQALDCNSGTLDTVRNVSDLHLSWTTGWKTCEAGQGCQETWMLIQNGQEFHMILTKGCTSDSNREARITRHRTGPGISIITYVHVCRHRDFCNDLSTTRNLWTPPPDTVPGTLRCPHCLSTSRCENAPEQVCPSGSSHCYRGVLRLRGEGIATNLRVQGCMPQAGCNLFDGTKAIGPIDVHENCGPQAEALKCRYGTLQITRDASQLPLQWTAGQTTCDVSEGCQDTLVMIENGEKMNLILLTKGCTTAEDQEAKVTEHRTGPGLSVTSYTRVCRLGDLCNDLSTTAPLWAPPPVTAPGTTSCPVCFSTHGCENPPQQVCPAGSSHCYSGVLRLRGGEISSDLRVQGCLSQPGCNLLNGTQTIGPLDLREDCSPREDPLTCYRGIMVKSGSGFAETAVKWSALSTLVCEPEELCQETLLLVHHTQTRLSDDNCSQINLIWPVLTVLALLKNSQTDTRSSPALPSLGEAMATCCIQYFLLLFLLGFTPYSDALVCKEGVMVTFGAGFAKKVVEWPSQETKIAGPKEACHETLVLIDIGPKSLLVGSKGSAIIVDEYVPSNRMYEYEDVHLYPDNGTVLMYSDGPGILAAMYHESCTTDLCNSDNTTTHLVKGLRVAEGTKTVVLASKGCAVQDIESMTFIQYTPPPGLVAVSYSNYCNETLCNNRDSISQFWKPPETTGENAAGQDWWTLTYLRQGRDPGKPEEVCSCPNKQPEEEFGVASFLLAKRVATTGGPYGENISSPGTQNFSLSGQGRDPGKPEEANSCPNKQPEEEFGVASFLLAERVVTQWNLIEDPDINPH
ncbi:hypothetical protein STEG23_027646, partial [Scotinomys teguina]